MNRRKALFSIAAAAIGQTAWGAWPGYSSVPTSYGLPSTESGDAAGGNRKPEPDDLGLIGAHVYSEEGIPMFLGCENTALVGVSPRVCEQPSELNRKVSLAFDRYSQEWYRHYPHAEADDAAKVVEFLAGRDFANGGLETSL